MAFSYSALNNYGKSGLPSVDSWGTNMNILKDPPKSIMTRRINKVGESSDITQMIQESGDRVCENIQVYARGVNPSVSVSYQNYGTNGGQLAGTTPTQAYLPYGIIRDGAFRPPILRQEQLTPLSRLPRVWTTALTNPGFADYSKKARVCGTPKDFREVKTENLKTCVQPTAVFNIQKPSQQTYDIKNAIQPVISNSVSAGIRTMDITTQNVKEPTKEVLNTALHAFAQANATQNKYVNNSTFDTNPYIQEHMFAEAFTNPSQNIRTTSLDAIADMSERGIRDIQTTSYSAPVSGSERTNMEHTPLSLDRPLPQHSYHSNVSNSSAHKILQHTNTLEFERNTPLTNCQANPSARGFHEDSNSRSAQLIQKVNAGGFDPRANMPTMSRAGEISHLKSRKQQIAQQASEHFGNRFD